MDFIDRFIFRKVV